jgi:hypothetical protein
MIVYTLVTQRPRTPMKIPIGNGSNDLSIQDGLLQVRII